MTSVTPVKVDGQYALNVKKEASNPKDTKEVTIPLPPEVKTPEDAKAVGDALEQQIAKAEQQQQQPAVTPPELGKNLDKTV